RGRLRRVVDTWSSRRSREPRQERQKRVLDLVGAGATRSRRLEDLRDARHLETVQRGQGASGQQQAGGHDRRAGRGWIGYRQGAVLRWVRSGGCLQTPSAPDL